MSPDNRASAYQETTFESAPPLKLVHMMYEGAMRFIEQAKKTDPVADRNVFDERLKRAGEIVCELRLNLNHDPAPELALNLEALYLFVEDRLRMAFAERSSAPLDAAHDVLTTLLEGWKGLEVNAA